jgi:hypothetical protein
MTRNPENPIMATPQEAKPDASSALPSDSPDIASKPPQVEENASAPPSIEAIKGHPPLAEASSLDVAGRPSAIEIAAEAPSEASEEPAAAGGPAALAAPPAHSSRFALLAATVALAAALGSIVGSLSASGIAHLWLVAVATPRSGVTEANALQAMKVELAELSALKANLDGGARTANSQVAKIADRLDHVERAQIDPATKIVHSAEAIDRLEKKSVTPSAASAGPETTGTIANSQPAAPVARVCPSRLLRGWSDGGADCFLTY